MAAVDYAKQVDTYADYALFRLAVESRDPKVVVEMSESLEKRSPQSEYVPKVREALFVAYRQSGANDKAVALAETVIASGQASEDMLLVVIDSYSQQKKEPEKVHTYAAKIAEILAAKPKPEGVSDADYTARKNQITGLAHYLSGKLYAAENKHAQGRYRAARGAPGARSVAEARGQFPARPRQLQDAEGAGRGEFLPRLCRHAGPVQGRGYEERRAHPAGISRDQVNLLIPNLGSTSLKYQVIEMPSEKVLAKGRIDA